MLKITDGKSWQSRQTSEEISGQMAQNVKLCLALRAALPGSWSCKQHIGMELQMNPTGWRRAA